MTAPITLKCFNNNSDVEYFFQRELDNFPRVDGRFVFVELGALMIRPKDEPKNRLTHLAFPPTVIGLPHAGYSSDGPSSRTFPQCSLMANSATDDLFLKYTSDHILEADVLKRTELIMPIGDVF